jgi:hypothetical protein
MPLASVNCPNCNVLLKPKTPIPEGTRLKCPKCATVFVAQGESAGVPPTVPAPPKAAPRPAAPAPAAATTPKPAAPKPKPAAAEADVPEVTEIIDDEAGDEAPAKPKKKGMPMWIWFAIGGGVLVFCCCPISSGGIYVMVNGVPGLGGNVTKTNYDKIKIGASEKEVTDFMGQPNAKPEDLAKAAGVPTPPKLPDMKWLIWKSGDNFIEAILIKDKVKFKVYKIGNESGDEGSFF